MIVIILCGAGVAGLRFALLTREARAVVEPHERRIDAREYERLAGKRPAFKEYLMQGESVEGIDLARDRSPDRPAC